MTSDARSLAASLAAWDDRALSTLFQSRAVPVRTNWRDFFDAAESLLSETSIALALTGLSDQQLEELSRLAAHPTEHADDAALVRAALVDSESHIFAPVARAVVELPQRPASDPQPNGSAEPVARAAERAFTTVGHLADLLAVILANPLAQIGTGAVSAADRRRLVESGVVANADDVEILLGIADASGLIRTHERAHWATSTGAEWIAWSNLQRWRALAEGVVSNLPDGVRRSDGTVRALSEWQGAYPLDPTWSATCERFHASVRLLGLILLDGTVAPWAAPLFQGESPDSAALAELLPHEVDRIYLQNDLTAISPGPLEATRDIRLRTMANRESHAQASTYRFTATRLTDAMTAGETEESLLAFLSDLSLTGIPQPLAYLIAETARRHGEIRVGTDPVSGRSVISSDNPTAIDTMSVDQTLRALGLTRLAGEGETADQLVSRVHRDTIAIALADAHYPVTLIAPDGSPERLNRHRVAPAAAEEPDPYRELIAELRHHQVDDSATAWLERELDLAVRQRSVIEVTVTVSATEERVFMLEAAGLGGGRLRGRDRAADVERTLPISHITAVQVIT